MMLVNVLGVLLIALIVWWFWLYQPQATDLGDSELIIVVENGTYQPSRIKLLADQPASLHFLRKDSSPCSETILIPDLKLSDTLPLNKVKKIALPAMRKGEYEFHCQMKMYRGRLVVE
ncbi:cupredoxin domain-containing protein [Oceanisphaera sediminis]|uniref:Cupredoxin domain-containing protein n=1 Tax=Oceanisphaera sediminis TaxID=981381 RepID=A0ABP7EBS6_9GAMM